MQGKGKFEIEFDGKMRKKKKSPAYSRAYILIFGVNTLKIEQALMIQIESLTFPLEFHLSLKFVVRYPGPLRRVERRFRSDILF